MFNDEFVTKGQVRCTVKDGLVRTKHEKERVHNHLSQKLNKKFEIYFALHFTFEGALKVNLFSVCVCPAQNHTAQSKVRPVI
jgi:hypothetical protein